MLLQASASEGGDAQRAADGVQQIEDAATHTHILDYAPVPGWTVHVTKEGRLYYCNHVTRTAGWLPPAEAWKSGEDSLPYGWERAVDDSGKPYYINHVNKTTTYETPVVKCSVPVEVPEPRAVILDRSPSLGFGFVAGSEKPVIVRFVTEGGPSVDKLLPGDQILSVNGEDVKTAPREHVISLVRACSTSVKLIVCQPPEQQGARKSTLLSASKRARLRSKPSRVRFAESVCVNGAPLFPPSAFSLGDLCVPPMANVLKVFLENGQTKSFKYDAWTTVQDVVESLQTKLCLTATEHFSLVVEHIKSLKRNKLTLLDPNDTLNRIASRPGAHKLRCLYRIAFVPTSAAALAQQDLAALDYLFTQCCNDVIQERFAPELQYDTALRLAALHVYQHALANNMQAAKLTVKVVEREFGLERFVPASLLEKMKRKEVRKLVAHFLKLHASMAGPGKQLTALQAKLHYLDLVSQLPSYGAKCFSAGPKADTMERVILVSPKFGLSQIMGSRNSIPAPIANIEDMRKLEVRCEDELSQAVTIRLKNDQSVNISLEERDANELVLVLRGYYKLATGLSLAIDKEEIESVEDLAPPYLSQHKVIPEKWSFTNQTQIKTISFASRPIYQAMNRKTNGLYNTMGRQSKILSGLDSNMNSSIANKNHFRNDEVLKEMEKLVENSEKYLSEQEWLETSVDFESDAETSDSLNKLHHSDSLLLLNPKEPKNSFTNAAIEILRSEIYSESDTDSLYSPHNSPKHSEAINKNVRISFGLHSPNNPAEGQDLRAYLEKLKETKSDLYVFDDIIDLTMLPPPATPDELDSTPPSINLPPITFADSMEKLGVLHENLDLEEFLASFTVPPPTQKVTPAVELTPEEIMSFIIPPPPEKCDDFLVEEKVPDNESGRLSIEYATVDRKGAFGCCSKGKESAKPEILAKPPPRRASDHKPPQRPPKNLPPERQRSHSLTSSSASNATRSDFPPKLPPRDDQTSHQPPPHLFLPPKKPPLPPVPPLEVLRSRKQITNSQKTAGIGSPHLQRSKTSEQSTAVSTPTSPYLGRGVQFSAVPIDYVNKGVPRVVELGHARSQSECSSSSCSSFAAAGSPNQFRRNGNNCMSSRENLLAKTDVAMASLLVRLDQVAAQCSAAQAHGGGRLMCEDKFQVAKDDLTAQSLQLVHSSKMLVIAMSDPTLPDLPENLAVCLTILRRLTELCTDLTDHTTSPLQTRNLVLKVHDVTSAFRHLINSNIDRSSQSTIEEHLAAEAESLANVLTTLLRSLRVFSP